MKLEEEKPKIVAVVAGNFREFLSFAREKGFHERLNRDAFLLDNIVYRFIERPEQLLGLRFFGAIYYGTYFLNSNACEIHARIRFEIKSNQWVEK